MISTKIRKALITLVAVSSFAVMLVAPAASQAQWHTIVVDGQVITHGNFTEGGVSPCTRIEGQLGSWEKAVGDYHEWVGRRGADRTIAKEELENAEGEANRASGEAFEYGCDTVTPAVSSSGATAPKGSASTSRTVRAQHVRASVR